MGTVRLSIPIPLLFTLLLLSTLPLLTLLLLFMLLLLCTLLQLSTLLLSFTLLQLFTLLPLSITPVLLARALTNLSPSLTRERRGPLARPRHSDPRSPVSSSDSVS